MDFNIFTHQGLMIYLYTIPWQKTQSKSWASIWLVPVVASDGTNTQVPSSDVITSLCEYSSVNEAWKVYFYVNGGASAIGDA